LGLIEKLSRSIKNPKKAAKHTFTRFDVAAGKKLYGNTSGMVKNLDRTGKVKSLNPELKKTNPQLYSLIENGYLKFQNHYDESTISNIKEKYEKLIENDEYSFAISGHEDEIYSRIIHDAATKIPEIAQLITDDIKSLLSGYYNSHFTINYMTIGRNYYVPENLRQEEMFSNVWHCDFSNTSGLKFFVYLSDVTEEDGSSQLQSINRTKELMKRGFNNRNNYDLPLDVLEDPSHVEKMMGPPGTSWFGNVTRCIHKAGIPEKGHIRDMVQIYIESSDTPLPKDWIKNVRPKPGVKHYIPKKNSQ